MIASWCFRFYVRSTIKFKCLHSFSSTLFVFPSAPQAKCVITTGILNQKPVSRAGTRSYIHSICPYIIGYQHWDNFNRTKSTITTIIIHNKFQPHALFVNTNYPLVHHSNRRLNQPMSLWSLKLFSRNINVYLQFESFLHSELAPPLFWIPFPGRQWPV